MLMKLIPEQYQFAAKLIAAAAIVGVIFLAGWRVQGWRLGQEIAQLEADLKTASENSDTLTQSLNDQSEKVKELESQARARQEAAAAALAAAQVKVGTLSDEIRKLKAARGETAADAEQLLDEALGL